MDFVNVDWSLIPTLGTKQFPGRLSGDNPHPTFNIKDMFKDILLLILSLIFPQKEDIYIKDHMILTNHTPSYIYWIDDSNVLLSSYGNTVIYNTINRKSNVIDTCKDCIYGYDFGLLL